MVNETKTLSDVIKCMNQYKTLPAKYKGQQIRIVNSKSAAGSYEGDLLSSELHLCPPRYSGATLVVPTPRYSGATLVGPTPRYSGATLVGP